MYIRCEMAGVLIYTHAQSHNHFEDQKGQAISQKLKLIHTLND
jgi:hypothetical protein